MTTTISNISYTTASSGGNVTNDGGTVVTERGVCWSTSQGPTIADSKTIDGNGTGNFTSNITGLTAGTLYFVRAYATNSVGTAYGNQVSFSTIGNCGTVSDNEGNLYYTVKVGSQCWMTENLKTTKYRNGINIPNITGDYQWANDLTGAYCCYNNDCGTYNVIYGKLYNWYAINNSNGLCPTGWHVPSDDEWCILENTVEVGTDPSCYLTGLRGLIQVVI